MADNLQKRPSKGILKNSSSFDKQDTHPHVNRKSAKWDEMNILETLHPADKDYGHMKIDEPKTPYNYVDPDKIDEVDVGELQKRIEEAAERIPKALQSNDSDEDEDDDCLTPEDKAKKHEFEIKRKKHYNEFYAVKLARKLLEEDEDDEEEAAAPSNEQGPSKSSPSRPK